MINKNIILIADRINKYNEDNILFSKTYEKIPNEYFHNLYNALSTISNRITHYQTPEDFLENIEKHKNEFVISLWSGENSRNRKSLIPSICEAYGLMYLGADCYVQTISQDKNLSKVFCQEVNILTPRSKLLYNLESLNLINDLSLPLIVKPNFEGGSIGISQENLVYNYTDAKNITKKLLEVFKQPILIEEFIEGDEISFVVGGNSDNLFLEAIRLYSNEINLKQNIMSYELKKLKNINIERELYTQNIEMELIKKIKNLYFKLGKVNLIRIDGRIKNNKFYCIELSPDVNLNSSSTVATAFQLKGFSYSEALEEIINLSIESDLYQNASKT